jgi:glycosyltransferase involved in cell wall biosynthesis
MKILYLITRSDLGGAQVHLLDLLRSLPPTVDPVVGVGEAGYLANAVRELGIPCHIVPGLTQPIAPLRDLRALFGLIGLIKEVRPALIHAHTSKAGVLGRLAARITGVPSVFTAHTWCFAEGTSLKWKLAGIPGERLAARCCSAIINVSKANRELAVSHKIAIRRLCVVHNGIPDTPLRARPDRGEIPTIALVARCCDQKDHSLLLRAVSEVSTPARVVLVGDGPTRPALEAEAQRLGIGKRVEFLGERKDVAQVLAKAHIFALPTKWEGFPLSILEAMRAGLPVIASDVGGVAEAVVDGVTGFLVPTGDAGGFRDRLAVLLSNSDIRRRMGDAGRRSYESKFTLEAMMRGTLAVYGSVLRGSDVVAPTLAIPNQSREVHADL